MVGLEASTAFPSSGILQFDKAVTNVGGGYVIDSGDPNYGKFIAPLNGTYQFYANMYSGKEVGAALVLNGNWIISATNGNVGSASLSAVIDLAQGDEVWLENLPEVFNTTKYNRYFTSFTGFLLHANQ